MARRATSSRPGLAALARRTASRLTPRRRSADAHRRHHPDPARLAALDAERHVAHAAARAARGGHRLDAPGQKHAIKHAVFRACGCHCVYCGRRLRYDEATLDHVDARARGGRDDPGNLVIACADCNTRKAALDLDEFIAREPDAGRTFLRYAKAVHRALKHRVRRAVSLACALLDAGRRADPA